MNSVITVYCSVVFNFARVNIVFKSNQSFVVGIKEWGNHLPLQEVER